MTATTTQTTARTTTRTTTPVTGWVPTPGSRVPPPAPAGYPGGLTPWGPLAGWWRRVLAVTLDALLVLPGLLLGLLPGCALVASATPAVDGAGVDGPAGTPDAVTTALGIGLAVLGMVAMYAPYLWSRVVAAGRTGQSWGRRVAGIRLVSERTGEPVGGAVCLARELLHGFDGILCLGYLWAAVDRKRRTVADRATGSIVVRA